jgi:hypothetical protein
VGRVAHHWLDHSDPFTCDDAARGRSTCTMIARRRDEVLALLSAHGTFPVVAGALPGVYDPGMPMGVCALDPGGRRFTGELLAGRLNASSDSALARMHDGGDVNERHLAAGCSPPLKLRASAMRDDEEVVHYSGMRRRELVGRVRHVANGVTLVPGVRGQRFPYRDVIVVESCDRDLPFSMKGDSGSLVVDRHRRAIGTVVGGAPAANLSYVLPLTGAMRWLGPRGRHFFEPED